MKEFPAYGIPRRRLGRWEMNFGYNWILTIPQIEIMQADLPHTLFQHDKGGKKGGKAFRFNPDDPAIRLQEEANRRRAERRREAPQTLDELFKD